MQQRTQQVEPYRKKRSLDVDQSFEELQIESDLLELEDYPKKPKRENEIINAEESVKEKTYFITDDLGRRKFVPKGVSSSKGDSDTLKSVKEKLLSMSLSVLPLTLYRRKKE